MASAVAFVTLTGVLGAIAQEQTVVRSPMAAAGIDRPDHPDAARLTAANRLPTSPVMLELFTEQNRFRAEVGRPPLIWSPGLVDEASALVTEIDNRNCSAWAARMTTEGIHAGVYWAPSVRGIGGSSTAQDLSARYIASEWREEGGATYSDADGMCMRETEACRAYAYIMSPLARQVGCDQTVCSNNAQVWICRFEGETAPVQPSE